MRNCFHDDKYPGQNFVQEEKRQGWFKRWVVRPLKAVFVKAPCAIARWAWNGAKALWNDESVATLRWKLYQNFWGTPFHRLCTVLIFAGAVAVYFWNPIAFKMAMITISCMAIYGAFVYTGAGVFGAGADAYKTQEMSHVRERVYEVEIANAQSTIDTAKARAKANVAQVVAKQLSARIEKEETARLLKEINSKVLSNEEIRNLLDSGELIL